MVFLSKKLRKCLAILVPCQEMTLDTQNSKIVREQLDEVVNAGFW
jgi:hypothetical protein